jgi:hypothetical protein
MSKSKKPTPPVLEMPDFGIAYVAKKSGLELATVRAKLRALKIKKSGRVYDFGNKAKADKVAAQVAA